MSLRLWLPLRGDTTNNGLDQNIEIEAYKVTEDADGKIGSCYLFNGSDSSIKITDPNFPTILNGDFSICMWVYNTDSDRAILFGNYENSSTFAFSLEKYAAHGIRFYWNGDPDFSFAPALLTLNTWVHIAITRKGNTVKGYMNGVLQKTSTATLNGTVANTSTVFRLGRDSRTGVTAFSGKLNDFRLYDHELSAKEVKEISQALIQHFPLNDFIGNENLLLDTMKDFGQSHNVYKIATFNFSKALVEGNTYTVTCKINMSEEKKSFGIWHTGNTGSYRCGEWQNRNSSGIYTWTFTANSYMTSQTSGAGYGYARVYVSNNEGTAQGSTTVTGTANVDWIKIEEGSVSTPYLPNPADAYYNSMGFNSDTVYDVSGYCNNGTFSSNKPTLALDSPRYSSCMKFTRANTNFIMCNRGGMVKDAITVNAWAYMDDWSTFTSGRIASCAQGGGWDFWPTNGKMSFEVGTGSSSNSYKYAYSNGLISQFSGWVMFTGVYDGLHVKLYINGVLNQDTEAYSEKTPIYYNSGNGLFIGAEAGSTTTAPDNGNSGNHYFEGKISDFRVYATALSDADILELYNSPISIDNTGKVHALEFREV